MKTTEEKRSHRLKLKMDKINNDFDIYKEIFMLSSACMIFLMQIYIILIDNGVDIFNFEFIKSTALRLICQIGVQLVGFAFINVAIFAGFYKYKEQKWIRNNRDKWIQGEWLHIHDKKNVRIGVLKIEQRFSLIAVKDAKNYTPNVDGIESKETSWNYISATFNPESMVGVKLLCSYIATTGNTFKTGLHAFKSIESDGKFPYKMTGMFSDTIEGKDGNLKDADGDGKLYFFKLTPSLRKYLCKNGEVDRDLLINFIYREDARDEEYHKCLRNVLDKWGHTLKQDLIKQ